MRLRELIDRLEKLSNGGKNDSMEVLVEDEQETVESMVNDAYINRYSSENDYYEYITLQIY